MAISDESFTARSAREIAVSRTMLASGHR